MRLSGRSSLQLSESECFLFLDESLSSNVVPRVYEITRHSIATIENEWPRRDRRNNPILDEEIFHHLENRGGPRSVWITADWRALRKHRNLIDTHHVSVLWLRAPGRNPTFEEQSSMLLAVLDRVRSLISESDGPVYLRVRLDPDDRYQPLLERLRGTLLQFPRQWETIRLV